MGAVCSLETSLETLNSNDPIVGQTLRTGGGPEKPGDGGVSLSFPGFPTSRQYNERLLIFLKPVLAGIEEGATICHIGLAALAVGYPRYALGREQQVKVITPLH